MSYIPVTNAHDIRFDFELFGGPQTASFTAPNASVAGLAYGQVMVIGTHWIGEIVTIRKIDDYRKSVVLSGLSRRIEQINFRGIYNCTESDGSTQYRSKSISDIAQILTDMRPLLQNAGLDLETASLYPNFATSIRPDEADVSGSLRDILTGIAQAAGKTWYVSTASAPGGQRYIRFATPNTTTQDLATAEEATTEQIKNVLIIEGAPRPWVDESGYSDSAKWARATQIDDYTGLSGYGSGQARFYSEKKLFAYANLASVATYGRREARVSVGWIGTAGAAGTFAANYFNAFAYPLRTGSRAEVIQNPSSIDQHEPHAHERGVATVSCEVMSNGTTGCALKIEYKVSSGQLLNSALKKADFVRPVNNHRDTRSDLVDKWKDPKKDIDPQTLDGSHLKDSTVPNTALAGYPFFTGEANTLTAGAGKNRAFFVGDDFYITTPEGKKRFWLSANGNFYVYDASGPNDGIATDWGITQGGFPQGSLLTYLNAKVYDRIGETEMDAGAAQIGMFFGTAYDDDERPAFADYPMLAAIFEDGSGPHIFGKWRWYDGYLVAEGIESLTHVNGAPKWSIEDTGAVTGTLKTEIETTAIKAVYGGATPTKNSVSYGKQDGTTGKLAGPADTGKFALGVENGALGWLDATTMGGSNLPGDRITLTVNGRQTVAKLEAADTNHADLVLYDDQDTEVLRVSGFDGTITVGNSKAGSPDVLTLRPPDNSDDADDIIKTNAWAIRKDGVMRGIKIGFKEG